MYIAMVWQGTYWHFPLQNLRWPCVTFTCHFCRLFRTNLWYNRQDMSAIYGTRYARKLSELLHWSCLDFFFQSLLKTMSTLHESTKAADNLGSSENYRKICRMQKLLHFQQKQCYWFFSSWKRARHLRWKTKSGHVFDKIPWKLWNRFIYS